MALLIITTVVVALTSTLAVAVVAHRASPRPELAQARAAASQTMAELTSAVRAADTANRLALAELAAAAVSHAQG